MKRSQIAKRRIQDAWKWICGQMPIRRATAQALVALSAECFRKEREQLTRKCEAEIEKEKERANRIISRCRVIEFSRDKSPHYRVTITFSPEMLGMQFCDRSDLEYIAKIVGRDVEYEIASSKFIHSARENDYLRRERNMPVFRMDE